MRIHVLYGRPSPANVACERPHARPPGLDGTEEPFIVSFPPGLCGVRNERTGGGKGVGGRWVGVTAPVPPVVDVCLYKYTPDMEKS